MPSLSLSRFEATEGRLPRMCMQCGAEAVTERKKNFSWHPQWVIILILVNLLIYVVVAMVLTKRMSVRAPFCDKHQNHWRWRAWFIWLGLVLVCVLGIGGLVLFNVLNERARGRGSDLGGFVCLAVGAIGLIWLIAAAIVQNSAIRPTEITDDGITLTHVCQEFVQAVWQQRDPRARAAGTRHQPGASSWEGDEGDYRSRDDPRIR